MIKKYKIKNFDFLLIFAVIMLTIFGILVVGSAKQDLQIKQIYGAIVGLIIMLAIAFIDYSFILKFYWVLYLFNVVLLLATYTPLGRKVYGAQRWIDIGGFGFQPSELAKILLILFFSQFIMKYKEKLSTIVMIFLTCLFLVC
jgi:rod shape determining protein RodA